MAFLLLIAAWFVGVDAADKLNQAHPLPVAWFEAAVTVALIAGGVVVLLVRGDD